MLFGKGAVVHLELELLISFCIELTAVARITVQHELDKGRCPLPIYY
jgi:hypothetical protein